MYVLVSFYAKLSLTSLFIKKIYYYYCFPRKVILNSVQITDQLLLSHMQAYLVNLFVLSPLNYLHTIQCFHI